MTDGTDAGARGALDGVRVVELSTGVAAAFCCRYLAGLGADVVKVEPPGGDPTRRLPPFIDAERADESSALFLYLNTGKRSVVLDVGKAEERERLRGLIAQSDVVVEDAPPGELAALGLGYADLAAGQPRLVVTSLTPFGQDGPYALRQAEAVTVSAWGGLLHTTGSPDREPLIQGGHQIEYQSGLVAALATAAAIVRAESPGGTGTHVDCSAMEAVSVMLDPNMYWNVIDPDEGRMWAAMSRRLGNQSPGAPRGVWPCRDGWVLAIPRLDRPVSALAELTGDERFTDPRLQTVAGRSEFADELVALLLPWLADRTREQAFHEAQALGHYFGYVCTVDELPSLPQLKARGFFREQEHPVAGTATYPGPPGVMYASPWKRSRAPMLGEHTARFPDAATGGSVRWRGETGAAATDSPLALDGVRILDFTRAWAGPLATRLLADLGADVVKVHALGGEGPRRNPTTGAYWRMLDGNKRAIAINLRAPEAPSVVKRLVRSTDIVVENFSRRVMPAFGLGYEALKEVRPDLIMVSMPGFGSTGPERDYRALGETIEGLSGLVSLTGYRHEDVPMKSGINYGDPIAGFTSALLAIAAVRHRRRTGEGQWIDVSHLEASVQFLGEWVVAHSRTGELPKRLGNGHTAMAPHGVYPAAGNDRWIAIAVRDDERWRAFVSVVDLPGLRNDPRFASAALRIHHRDELDALVAAATASSAAPELASALNAAGVAAAPVQTAADVLEDKHHRTRGFWRTATSSRVGVHPYNRPPIVLGDIDIGVQRSAPTFSEHLREVLGEWGGLGRRAIDALIAKGVVSEQPISQNRPAGGF